MNYSSVHSDEISLTEKVVTNTFSSTHYLPSQIDSELVKICCELARQDFQPKQVFFHVNAAVANTSFFKNTEMPLGFQIRVGKQ